jgi:hypothetical protein
MTLLDGTGQTTIICGVFRSPGTTPSTELSPLLTAMILRLSAGLAAVVCVSMISCVPYNESPKKKVTKTAEKTAPLPPEQQKLKDQEEAKKKAEADLKKQEEIKKPEEQANRTVDPPEPAGKENKRTDYAFANKVPGKEGFVFSPYNNKVVDVRDIPSGTLVQDPTYPAAEKKYFRVP